MTKGIILNVGARKSKKYEGFLGPIFQDGSFKFLPILDDYFPQCPTYRSLGLSEYVPEGFTDKPVHNDPEFSTNTYGHVRRFNELGAIAELDPGDYLFFMSGLGCIDPPTKSWTNARWGMYVIGYLKVSSIFVGNSIDLQWPKIIENQARVEKEFGDNAHVKRGDMPDLLIKGDCGSGLLPRAAPLSSNSDPLRLNSAVVGILSTLGGRPIDHHDRNWYRWILKCEGNALDALMTYID